MNENVINILKPTKSRIGDIFHSLARPNEIAQSSSCRSGERDSIAQKCVTVQNYHNVFITSFFAAEDLSFIFSFFFWQTI